VLTITDMAAMQNDKFTGIGIIANVKFAEKHITGLKLISQTRPSGLFQFRINF